MIILFVTSKAKVRAILEENRCAFKNLLKAGLVEWADGGLGVQLTPVGNMALLQARRFEIIRSEN